MDFKSVILLWLLGLTLTREFGLSAGENDKFHMKLVQNQNFTGDYKEWNYHHRDGIKYKFNFNDPSIATNSASRHGLFRFVFHSNDGQYDSISIETHQPFYTNLLVNADGILSTSSTQGFTFKIVNNVTTERFYLYIDGEPLVTRHTREPFYFYKQSLFPDEEPAEFSNEPYHLNIEEFYAGERTRIQYTAQLIHAMGHVNKESAYLELVQLLKHFNQTAGKEIFMLGQYILESLGFEGGIISSAFKALPQSVQLILSGKPFSIFYEDPIIGLGVPLRKPEDSTWARASNKSGIIEPYRTTNYSELSLCSDCPPMYYEISYGNGFYLDPSANLAYKESGPHIRSVFSLSDDLETLYMHSFYGGNTYEARKISGETTYVFGESDQQPANFRVSPYKPDFELMYGIDRNHILDIAKLISRDTEAIPDQHSAYDKLLELMEFHNHTEGREIFQVGAYILDDLGIESAVFKKLPALVQLVIGGKGNTTGLSLTYVTDQGQEYPMKYYWASDLNTNIMSYKFLFSKADGRFAIVYSPNNNWIVPTTGNESGGLTDSQTSGTKYIFHLYLNEGYDTLHVRCWFTTTGRSNPLVTVNSEPDFYFNCDPSAESGATLVLKEYVEK